MPQPINHQKPFIITGLLRGTIGVSLSQLTVMLPNRWQNSRAIDSVRECA